MSRTTYRGWLGCLRFFGKLSKPARTGTHIFENISPRPYARRILLSFPGKATAEIHDHHDIATSVLAASLAKRAPDTPAPDSQDPAASPTRRVRMPPRKSLTRPADGQCVITPNLVSRVLKLNRCSTTRASMAGERSQPLPAPTAS